MANAHSTLQKQGVRSKPAQFEFTIPEEFQQRGLAVLRADIGLGQTPEANEEALVVRMLGAYDGVTNPTPVIWRSNYFERHSLPDPWAWIHSRREVRSDGLNAARAALLAGPIGFRVKMSDGMDIKTGHIRQIISAMRTFNLCVVSDLHDGRFDQAWTNILAATRCVTAWKAEPTPLAQRARTLMVNVAFAGIWQALQADVWSDAQLSALENEWTNVNFFAALPEMVEFEGASLVQAMNIFRADFTASNLTIRDLLDEPKQIPDFIKDYVAMAWYRYGGGLYEDQRDVLYYLRDRRTELRGGIGMQTLSEMLPLPGMTNGQPFVLLHNPLVTSLITVDLFSINAPNRGLGVAGSAVKAEIRRRLILAAISIEKQRVRTGKYPDTLEGPVFFDFADGQKLRYRRLPDDRFLIYSIGLDCIDNGGNAASPANSRDMGIPEGIDIVWPMPGL
ncbi:MAG TPA: hypothetical protein VM680_14605 [Verrucomicrobiae bacterium]|nr:hypothetical protein [Verrucomicrobiae bacterium]